MGSVEIGTQASCVCGMPQIRRRLSPGRPVSPCRGLVHLETAGLCHTSKQQQLLNDTLPRTHR